MAAVVAGVVVAAVVTAIVVAAVMVHGGGCVHVVVVAAVVAAVVTAIVVAAVVVHGGGCVHVVVVAAVVAAVVAGVVVAAVVALIASKDGIVRVAGEGVAARLVGECVGILAVALDDLLVVRAVESPVPVHVGSVLVRVPPVPVVPDAVLVVVAVHEVHGGGGVHVVVVPIVAAVVTAVVVAAVVTAVVVAAVVTAVVVAAVVVAAEVPVAIVVALPLRVPVGVRLGLVRVPPSHVVPLAADVVVTGGVVIGRAVADGDVEEIAVGVAAEPVGLVDARGAIVGEHGRVDGGGLRLRAVAAADGDVRGAAHELEPHAPAVAVEAVGVHALDGDLATGAGLGIVRGRDGGLIDGGLRRLCKQRRSPDPIERLGGLEIAVIERQSVGAVRVELRNLATVPCAVGPFPLAVHEVADLQR